MKHPLVPIYKRSSGRGLTLVELLISLFLGLLLLSAILSAMINFLQTSRVQTGLNEIQNSARYVLDLMARELRKSGYRPNVKVPMSEAFPPASNVGLEQSKFIAGDNKQVTFRYMGSGSPQPDGRVSDCLGNNIAANVTATLRISNIDDTVVCEDLSKPQADAVVLAQGVEDFSLSYGIETTGDGYADSYVSNPASTDEIVSVKITFTMLDTKTFLDTSDLGTGENAATLQKGLRRSFGQVTAIRNVPR